MVYKNRINDWHLCLHLVLVSFTFSHQNTSAGLHCCHSRTILPPSKAKKRVIYCPISAVTMNFKMNTTSQDRPFPASWEQMWWASRGSRSILSVDIFRIWKTKMDQTSPAHRCWFMRISYSLPYYCFGLQINLMSIPPKQTWRPPYVFSFPF